MTAAVGQDGSTGEAQRNGLTLLRLMAEAADANEKSLHWVNRRVDQLEFLDVRAVRRRVSVDFEVPETAPVIDVGGEDFRLVPLTSWEKDNPVAFDLRDETGKTMWLPTSADTDHLMSSALICGARTILEQSPVQMPSELKETLTAIVSERPPMDAKDEDKDLFAYMTKLMTGKHGQDVPGRYLTALKGNQSFWSQANELWRNFLIIVAVPDKPRTRHVFKMTFESKIEFGRAGSMGQRIAQSMGWREWRLELFIGGRGGSQHLEIAAHPESRSSASARSRFRPKGPDKTMANDRENEEEDQPAEQEAEPTPTSLAIPSADGYHYGDHNNWGDDEQHDLVCALREAESASGASQVTQSQPPVLGNSP